MKNCSQGIIGGNIIVGAGADAIFFDTCNNIVLMPNKNNGYTNNYGFVGGLPPISYWDANPLYIGGFTASDVALSSTGLGGLGNRANLNIAAAFPADLSVLANNKAHSFNTDGGLFGQPVTAGAPVHDLQVTSAYFSAFGKFQLVFDNANNYGMLENLTTDQWWFGTSTDGTTTATTGGLGWAEGGNALLGLKGGALATNANNGFAYIPTCAGPPTGTPTAYTGKVAMVYDTTNNKFYIYNGAWKGGTSPGVFT